eukprot:gnl/MRDRNA2_/MRDRNA2_29791_c0_seq1.p1 gnl/MRDRNA2_/MRDRNA2_29791_c0~~gnl/MRDRNA2_/MRDRNA2_29791_c0_seq1.p1  ORF type:complete len:707 (-),score=155.07 gnl/MRDRNA2_/MRDRNA2_29791_c0_seq1:64-2184(-)
MASWLRNSERRLSRSASGTDLRLRQSASETQLQGLRGETQKRKVRSRRTSTLQHIQHVREACELIIEEPLRHIHAALVDPLDRHLANAGLENLSDFLVKLLDAVGEMWLHACEGDSNEAHLVSLGELVAGREDLLLRAVRAVEGLRGLAAEAARGPACQVRLRKVQKSLSSSMEDMRERLQYEMQAHATEHEQWNEQWRKEKEKYLTDTGDLTSELRDSNRHVVELEELREREARTHNLQVEQLEVNCRAEIGKLEAANAANLAVMEEKERKLEAAHSSELSRTSVKMVSLQSLEASSALRAADKAQDLQEQLTKAWHQADIAMAEKRHAGRELEEVQAKAAAQARRADIAKGEALQRLADRDVSLSQERERCAQLIDGLRQSQAEVQSQDEQFRRSLAEMKALARQGPQRQCVDSQLMLKQEEHQSLSKSSSLPFLQSSEMGVFARPQSGSVAQLPHPWQHQPSSRQHQQSAGPLPLSPASFDVRDVSRLASVQQDRHGQGHLPESDGSDSKISHPVDISHNMVAPECALAGAGATASPTSTHLKFSSTQAQLGSSRMQIPGEERVHPVVESYPAHLSVARSWESDSVCRVASSSGLEISSVGAPAPLSMEAKVAHPQSWPLPGATADPPQSLSPRRPENASRRMVRTASPWRPGPVGIQTTESGSAVMPWEMEPKAFLDMWRRSRDDVPMEFWTGNLKITKSFD